MDNSLHWNVGESQHALNRIYEIDKGLTTLETLLDHGIHVWVEDAKLKFWIPDKTLKEQTPDHLHNIKTIAIVSDPDSVRKAFSDAQSAIAELFNHSSVLEDDLERLSEVVKRRNNDNNN